MNLRSLVCIEVVALTLAPFAVAFDKDRAADGRDALGVSEGRCKVPRPNFNSSRSGLKVT